MKYLPNFVIDWYFYVFDFLSYDCGLNIPLLNLRKNHFGQILIYDMTKSGVNDITFPIPSMTRNCGTFTLCNPRLNVLVDDEDQVYVEK